MPLHPDFPFRFDRRGQVVCVEQDSIEEVAASVAVILSTSPGDRISRPAFGAGDAAFRHPVGVEDLINRAADQEPRARLHIDDETLTAAVNLRLRVEVTDD